ncbi:histidine ammonia-lyase [Allonocardiopsis opalescens]|uniref:Histidine ammonia-lyase n=1 Tax=Allonocardiopsis opalescens TaxID=1144618 RepID=A0A2T0PYE0_9ACTN|nr:histidine ammonia-lyase [Allonocardiopsis opalescens]PRX96528.1 histidine ammonia-lyase [Allonocardiopsis opalescens]
MSAAADRPTVEISTDFYSLDALMALVDEPPRLALAPEVAERIDAGARYVERIAPQDRHIYGINTGFGPLCETRIPADRMSELQHKHLVSHACGVGEPVPERVSRLAMLVKLLTFRAGYSGISLEAVQRVLDLWNADVIPVVPKKGTVGASGDLAPLAHLALPLIGLGKVRVDGRITDAGAVLEAMGWKPLRLKPKEGLALTNGVQYINALALDSVLRSERLIKAADLIAGLSIQGFSCADTFYQPILHATSLHPERSAVAGNLVRLLDGSNHHTLPQGNAAREDPYSFRCAPQVHAAVRQTCGFARDIVGRECNSVSDNPLFFPEHDQVILGGNLHGESTAFALDFLAIAMSELANISERRTYQLLSGQHGLPDFLAPEPGVDSGLMIPQYTSAALVNENKVLATPASIDTIPTSQLQEDHVSMGGTSAYKLWTILDNCEYVLAVELMTAVQAIDLNQGLRPSPATRGVVAEFRQEVGFLREDRLQADDIEKSRRYLRGRLRTWAKDLD